MTTIFDLLNNAADMNARRNRTYGSLNEKLSEEQINEKRKDSWNLSVDESDIYEELKTSDRARLIRFS